jgi:hypothetical protein
VSHRNFLILAHVALNSCYGWTLPAWLRNLNRVKVHGFDQGCNGDLAAWMNMGAKLQALPIAGERRVNGVIAFG